MLASYWHADEQREAVASGIGGTLLKHLDGSALARQLRALSEPTIVTNAPTPEFPGIPAIIDGSEAIAYVETRISDGACAYPITPSTTMAAVYQVAVANGTPNLWGTHLKFIEPESEHSSASAAEGFALAGGRVTNFTAGQGLILMKEVLYVIAGKRLPVVFHVGARALTSQSLNIHAGHDDMMGVADCGWGMFFARNCQEAADLTAIARRVAEDGETPWFVAQDGFLTTHTIENVQLPEDELLKRFVGDPRVTVRDLFDTEDGLMSGVVQNQDSYMKGRIGQRAWYEQLAEIAERAMAEWAALTGRQLRPDRRPTRPRTPTTSWSRWGPWLTRPSRSSTHLRCRRPQGRLHHGHELPALPGDAAGEALAQREGRGSRGADGRAGGRGQSAHPRAQVGPRRRGDGRRAACRVSCRPRPASAPATSSPATSGPSSTGWPTRRRSRRRRRAFLGIRHPLGSGRATSTFAPRAPTACAATRSAASAPSPRTSSWRRPWASSSTCTSRPIRATARRRRACPPPTSSPSPRSRSGSTTS